MTEIAASGSVQPESFSNRSFESLLALQIPGPLVNRIRRLQSRAFDTLSLDDRSNTIRLCQATNELIGSERFFKEHLRILHSIFYESTSFSPDKSTVIPVGELLRGPFYAVPLGSRPEHYYCLHSNSQTYQMIMGVHVSPGNQPDNHQLILVSSEKSTDRTDPYFKHLYPSLFGAWLRYAVDNPQLSIHGNVALHPQQLPVFIDRFHHNSNVSASFLLPTEKTK